MLLIDEEYGADAIAAIHGGDKSIQVVVPVERSGQPEFIFEHGDDFGTHIEASGADIVKALVRYNPAGDPELNARSRTGLLRLAKWLDARGMPLMLELLVPPTAAQCGYADFDTTIRPGPVDRRVAMAAAAPGFDGFAAGRTIWAGPLGEWLTGADSRADAIAAISANYPHFARAYLDNRRG